MLALLIQTRIIFSRMELVCFQESSSRPKWSQKSFLQFQRPLIPFLTFVFILASNLVTEGRKCYFCSTALDSDQFDCLYNVENVTEAWRNVSLVYCRNYCTIRRQEYADYPGGINYLNRSCEDEKLDEVIFSGIFITYLRSCRRDLCNSGDGIQSMKDLPEDEDDLPEVEVDTEESNMASNSVRHILPSIFILLLHFHLALDLLKSYPY